ncbi:hypothetical protein ANN_10728 [Periplaneta americana]|uniref:Uncharacterized protein n=1 Tax=Periplaneta americana TaxID=6978 RepID=A0ABQ8T4G1_PERAM|nr:hypothetical protein ANN_10728 [Periplaneta americana]
MTSRACYLRDCEAQCGAVRKQPMGWAIVQVSGKCTIISSVSLTIERVVSSSYMTCNDGSASAYAVTVKRNNYLELLDRYNFGIFAVETMEPAMGVPRRSCKLLISTNIYQHLTVTLVLRLSSAKELVLPFNEGMLHLHNSVKISPFHHHSIAILERRLVTRSGGRNRDEWGCLLGIERVSYLRYRSWFEIFTRISMEWEQSINLKFIPFTIIIDDIIVITIITITFIIIMTNIIRDSILAQGVRKYN